jgi:very-short-patch-repair endonuclease
MTRWEIRLWSDLKGKKMFGFKVRRQYGFENYIIDFYCPALKLAIEIDGSVHYFDGKDRKDTEKNGALKTAGIKVVRIENLDFEEDYESVILYLGLPQIVIINCVPCSYEEISLKKCKEKCQNVQTSYHLRVNLRQNKCEI